MRNVLVFALSRSKLDDGDGFRVLQWSHPPRLLPRRRLMAERSPVLDRRHRRCYSSIVCLDPSRPSRILCRAPCMIRSVPIAAVMGRWYASSLCVVLKFVDARTLFDERTMKLARDCTMRPSRRIGLAKCDPVERVGDMNSIRWIVPAGLFDPNASRSRGVSESESGAKHSQRY